MSFIFVADNLLKLHNQLLKFAYSLTLNDDDANDLLHKFINKAISSINNDKQKVIFGLYMSKYKYEEIAQEMNLPLGTIKRELHTIKLDLQKKLIEFKADSPDK